MKIGEFYRKLREAVCEEGYTVNNVELLGVESKNTESSVFKVYCQGNKGNTFEIYIEED